jgi:hypothetical protein
MKKISIFIMVLALVSVFACSAQEVIYYENVPTVTFLSDLFDIPVDPEVSIEHEIYLFDDSLGVIMDQNINDLVFVGTTTNLELLLIEPYKAYWAIAVRTKVTNKYGEATFSDFAYSLVASDTTDGKRFVIAHVSLQLQKPNKPTMIMIIQN